jgi:predicted peroxiredoxin
VPAQEVFVVQRSLALSSSLAFALLLSACAAPQRAAAPALKLGKPTVLLSVISGADKPHNVTMALQLANHALAAKRRVVLFFSVRGVQIPQQGLNETLAFNAKPLKTLLAEVIKNGAEVQVCPHCLKALKVDAKQLVAGAKVTTRELLFSALGPNTQVFTF